MTYGFPVSGKSTLAKALQDNGIGIIIKSVVTRNPESTKRFTTASIDERVEKTRREKDESYRRLLSSEYLHGTVESDPVHDVVCQVRVLDTMYSFMPENLDSPVQELLKAFKVDAFF